MKTILQFAILFKNWILLYHCFVVHIIINKIMKKTFSFSFNFLYFSNFGSGTFVLHYLPIFMYKWLIPNQPSICKMQ